MLSTTQLDYLEPMVQGMLEQGYPYYLAHTNTNFSSGSNYNWRDLTIYFSKTPFTCNGYTFEGFDVLKFDVITRNASSNSSDGRNERVLLSNISYLNLNIPDYEFISTNADNSFFMNHLAITEYQSVNDISYNVNLNDFWSFGVLIAIIILLIWLKSWFGRNGGNI